MPGISIHVERRIQETGRGSVWTPKDFADLGTRSAVGETLRRLVTRGVLQRIERGIYSYPAINRRLAPLTPAPDTIAAAVVRATGSKLQLSGARAANVLGLSAQVPAKSVYLTDGRSRRLRIGRQIIEIKHVPASQLFGAGTGAGMVFQALQHLGPHGADARVTRKLRSRLSVPDKRLLRRIALDAPAWMQPVLEQISMFE
jgi:hypothetical protein